MTRAQLHFASKSVFDSVASLCISKLCVQVVERHSLRLYTEWSLFESDLRELIHLLHSSLHAHLDAHDGDDVSALIPPLVRCADEALLPLPPLEANAYADAAATMPRTAAEELLVSQWGQQCPAAAGQVMAAIILVIETVKSQSKDERQIFSRLGNM